MSTRYARRFVEDGPRKSPISDAELHQLPIDNPDMAFIIALGLRSSVNEFLEDLEHSYYSPDDDDKNFLFELFIISWPNSLPFKWALVGIPLTDILKAERVAARHGLELKKGAIPITNGTIVTSSDTQISGFLDFILPRLENVFTVERP